MAERSGCGERDELKRRDIYLVSLDPTAGHEQRSGRPVLIVSPDLFNRLTNTAVTVPITSGGGFARKTGYAVSLQSAGTRTTGVIRCDQPRTIDLTARKGRRLESVPEEIVGEVLARVATLFE